MDFVPLPPQAQPSLGTLRSLGLALIVLVSSLVNPLFVVRRRAAVGNFDASAVNSLSGAKPPRPSSSVGFFSSSGANMPCSSSSDEILVPQRALDLLEEVRRQALALNADAALHAAASGGPVGAAPPAEVAPPRAQSRAEIDRMRHLGPRYLNSESQEFRLLFSAFALRSPSPPLMGSSTGNTTSAAGLKQRVDSPPHCPEAEEAEAAPRTGSGRVVDSPPYCPEAEEAEAAPRTGSGRVVSEPESPPFQYAHGGKLARSFPDPSAAPNELPSNVYDFLERARAINTDQEELRALHSGLPQYDDDEFMTELAALPDQDEAEEARVRLLLLVRRTCDYRVRLLLLVRRTCDYRVRLLLLARQL